MMQDPETAAKMVDAFQRPASRLLAAHVEIYPL